MARASDRLLFATLTLLLAGVASGQDGKPRLGRPIERPAGQTQPWTYGLLADEPQARIAAPGEVEIRFKTQKETPPALVYLGLNTMEEELDFPRYRVAAREKGDKAITDHVIRADFRTLVGLLPHTPFEPRLQWRVEVLLPDKGTSRFLEGRVYFDPKTLGDTVNIPYGPFVDLVGPDRATISWQTDRPSDGVVEIAGRRFTSEGPATRHEVHITGLKPDTRYPYRVKSGDTLVRPYELRTAGAKRFRFATMVDSREGYGGGMHNYVGVEAMSLRALTTHAYHQGVSFFLFGGDLISGYTTSEQDFRNQLDSFRRATMPVHARVPIFEGMGNHEALMDIHLGVGGVLRVDKAGAASAEAVFGSVFVNPKNGPPDEGPDSPPYAENVYAFDWGNVRVLVLNNNYWWCSNPHRYGGNLEGYILPVQMEWLRKQVAAADADPKVAHLFVAGQEPPFPNGGHSGDAMWYKGGDTNRDGKIDERDIDIVGNRNTMWEILAGSAKTVAFITGDEHSYSRLLVRPETPVGHHRTLDGREGKFRHAVWQITSGGAGAPFYDKEEMPWSGDLAVHSTLPHYAMFEIDGKSVHLSAWSLTGQRIDEAVLRPR